VQQEHGRSAPLLQVREIDPVGVDAALFHRTLLAAVLDNRPVDAEHLCDLRLHVR
jgi:hypothetical protein